MMNKKILSLSILVWIVNSIPLSEAFGCTIIAAGKKATSDYYHMNEVQPGIAESTTVQKRELVCTRENGKQIMTIEQAMIFALQRKNEPGNRNVVDLRDQIITRYTNNRE